MLKDPDIEGVFSVMGFSFSGAAPNQALIFTSLKPFVERRGADHELKKSMSVGVRYVHKWADYVIESVCQFVPTGEASDSPAPAGPVGFLLVAGAAVALVALVTAGTSRFSSRLAGRQLTV